MKGKLLSKLSRRQRVLLVVCLVMLLTSGILFLIARHLSGILYTQQEAERWQGESETEFSQVSCYLPADAKIGLNAVQSFRNAAMTKLREASVDVAGDEQLMLDCWSTTGKVVAVGETGKGDAAVIAVGGSFFDFHPIRLISGDYLRQSDLMQDRVLLDEELAWLLFGGTDLTGMTVKLNGVPFMVAGVIERETDFASRKAYTAGLGLFMSYDAYTLLEESAGISCYEFVLAQPVKDFAVNVAREKFPIGQGEIVCNTTRFEYGRRMDVILKYGTRSTQNTGVIFPYWENAARMVEDWAGLWTFLATVLLILPVIFAIVEIYRFLVYGKEKLEDEYWPEFKDRAEEAIRVRQRRRWERQHGMHEKKE